jgi:Leucine-rich repeat (LRR) protein
MLLLLPCIAISCISKKSLNNIDDEYLHIDGRRYDYLLSKLDKIEEFTLFLQLHDNGDANNLEGIELLTNLKKLTIIEEKSWFDLSSVDYSPLNKLKNLKKLDFYYVTLNEFPDFSGIPSLEWIWIYRCNLLTMNGFEKAKQIRQLDIVFENYYFGDFKPVSELANLEILSISGSNYINDEWENTAIRIADLSGLSKLKILGLGNVKNIDLEGIQNMPNLEILYLDNDANIMNVHTLAELKHLRELHGLVISSAVPSLNFLGSMTSLSDLDIYGRGRGNTIDITPLKNLSDLEYLGLFHFTITNFHILDNLPKLRMVYTYGSDFYPENNNRLKNAGVYYVHDR